MREWGWNFPVELPDRPALRHVTAYALTMQGGSIVGFSIDPISRYLLAAAAGPAAVTPLDIAFRTAGQWFGSALAFTRPILPSLGHLAGGGEVVAQSAELLWKRFFDVAVACGGYVALLAYFVFPVLFGDIGHYAGRLAAIAVLLWTPSVVAIIPYLYIVLYGRARDVFMIQLATSGVGMALLLALVWSIGAWAAVLGTGVGSLTGSLLTVRIARRQAGKAATFGLSGLSARALAAPVVAALILVLPIPLAARMSTATLLWAILAFRPIRDLLRVL
jgi:O-antigen/teichoic acid export membrane protein